MDAGSDRVYGIAVILAVSSLSIVLLILPPMYWHYRNRNTGAAVLVAWVVYCNFQSFLNAVIWPSDNIDSWYDGKGLCDIEVKLLGASTVGIPIALVMVLRGLARVFDLDHAKMPHTAAQRRRTVIRDLCVCLIPPALFMFAQYICQPYRYYLFGIAGCVPSTTLNWVNILLELMPPVVILAVGAYYVVLIVVRVYRYRMSFNSILATGNITRSRFYRLYLISLTFFVGVLPTQLYVISQQISSTDYSYNWAAVHANIDQIIMVPSNGSVLYDRWIWMAMGICVFIFFGTGRDSLAMYRKGLLFIKFDKMMPALRPNNRNCPHVQPSSSSATLLGSFRNKVKSVFEYTGGGDSSNVSSTAATLLSSGSEEAEMISVSHRSDLKSADQGIESSNLAQSGGMRSQITAQIFGGCRPSAESDIIETKNDMGISVGRDFYQASETELV